MSVVGTAHANLVFNRRVRVLASHLSKLLPKDASVLDVGSGDGTLDKLILTLRPDVSIQGIDIMVRAKTHIQVTKFDGQTIPFGDGSFDVVLFVDVLHHTEAPEVLLREAKRVARLGILLKDHLNDGFLAGPTLRLMDWVGNSPHGVVLPYNYWTKSQWQQAFKTFGLGVKAWESRIGLYPWPADYLFGRSLHFVAMLSPEP